MMDGLLLVGAALLAIGVVSAVVAPMRTIKVMLALLLVVFCMILLMAILVGMAGGR